MGSESRVAAVFAAALSVAAAVFAPVVAPVDTVRPRRSRRRRRCGRRDSRSRRVGRRGQVVVASPSPSTGRLRTGERHLDAAVGDELRARFARRDAGRPRVLLDEPRRAAPVPSPRPRSPRPATISPVSRFAHNPIEQRNQILLDQGIRNSDTMAPVNDCTVAENSVPPRGTSRNSPTATTAVPRPVRRFACEAECLTWTGLFAREPTGCGLRIRCATPPRFVTTTRHRATGCPDTRANKNRRAVRSLSRRRSRSGRFTPFTRRARQPPVPACRKYHRRIDGFGDSSIDRDRRGLASSLPRADAVVARIGLERLRPRTGRPTCTTGNGRLDYLNLRRRSAE